MEKRSVTGWIERDFFPAADFDKNVVHSLPRRTSKKFTIRTTVSRQTTSI